MTTLELITFIVLAVWIGATVIRADRLISDIHKRLEEIEESLRERSILE